jgi:cytochrome c553
MKCRKHSMLTSWKSKFITPSMLAVAALALSLPVNAQGTAKAAPQKAKASVSMCVGCHEIGGYKASFPAVYSVPLIHGQSAKYLENALQAYKKGERSHPTMRAIAGSLSDTEMAELAAHFAGSAAVKK